ncbi:MAG: hypothetical protein JSV03_14805, partial [Planctomycetota bacterium]
MSDQLFQFVERALQIRQPLIDDAAVDAYRIFNGQADGIAGLVIERFGDVLIVQLHEQRLRFAVDEVRTLVGTVHEQLSTRAVYRKMFVRDRSKLSADISRMHASAKPWIGQPVEPQLMINEDGLRFMVRPYGGFSVGLFLEHRDNRRRIRELAD